MPLTTGNRRQKTAEAIPRSFFCIVHFLYTFPVFSASTACSPRSRCSRCSRCSPHFLRSSPFSAPSAHPHPPLLLPLVFSSVPVCPCLLPPSFPALPLQPVLLVPRNLFMCDLSFFLLSSFAVLLLHPLRASSWGLLFLGVSTFCFLSAFHASAPPLFLCDSLGIVINVFNGFEYLKITLSLVGCKIIFIFVGQEF